MSTVLVSKAEMRKRMQMPLRKAYQIAMQSIKVRFWRSMVTGSSIMLGIAFFAYARTTTILSVFNTADALENRQRLLWLSFMSLLICLVGITNGMLMSVTERYKEIGTMKCLGATDSFIVKVFLIESTLMGLIASAAGALVGFIISFLIRWMTDGSALFSRLNGGDIGMMFLLSIAIGMILTILAAIFPAIRAARMPAVSALRVEV